MTVTQGPPPAAPPTPAPPTDPNKVTLTIDGVPVTVPKGTNVLEAARTLGLDISAFCYHPGLPVVAQCRQCLVSVEKNPKLQPSCQQTCGEGMVVHTTDVQSTTARKQMLEFTLLNHPIDCPICDKAGECTLQKLYFEHDNENSRVDVPKVEKAKVVDLGPTVVLDQERCILCSRCIRTCDVVAGDHQLEFAHRGDHEVLTTAPGALLDNPYSLNTVDVCPVGALTAKDFRFTMRAWELEATPSICNGCATGCNIEIHHKHERAWRLVPRHNPDVNAYWMCDEGRFTYHDLREQRLAGALVDGLPAGWDRALAAAAQRIAAARSDGSLGVVLSAVSSNEDNFALAKLASAWGLKSVFVAKLPDVPSRADGRLRVADVNPNVAGVEAIANALGLAMVAANPAALTGRRVVMLGDAMTGYTEAARRLWWSNLPERTAADLRQSIKVAGEPSDADLARMVLDPKQEKALAEIRLKDLDVIALAAHERQAVLDAKVALPIADWAEISGTITNNKGHVQRMHAAFPTVGQALAGWEAVVRLAQVTGAALKWTHAREVFADMTAAVPAWAGLKWAREARPLSLRFAGSRG